MCSGVPPYQASGSARIARSGLSGWAKKNQCHQAVANRASQRARASAMGTLSSTASADTASRVVEREAQRDVAAPVVPDDGEALVPEAAHEGEHVAAIARFEYGAWSSVVVRLADRP